MSDSLCQEQDPSTSAGRIKKTLLLTLLLLVISNFAAKFIVEERPALLLPKLVRTKWQLLAKQEKPADILVLGDSAAAFNVDADHITEKTGYSCLNLATAGQVLPFTNAWMLNEYIQKVGKPKVVIFTLYPPHWENVFPNAYVLADTPLAWGFWEQLNPTLQTSATWRGRLFLSRYLPLFSKNGVLKTRLRFWQNRIRLASVSAQGTVQMDEIKTEFHSRGSLKKRIARKGVFQASFMSQYAFKALQQACEEHDIAFIVVNTVVLEELTRMEGYPVFMQQVEAQIRELLKSAKGVTLFLREPVVFKPEKMYDESHARPEAAKEFTDRLLQRIGRF